MLLAKYPQSFLLAGIVGLGAAGAAACRGDGGGSGDVQVVASPVGADPAAWLRTDLRVPSLDQTRRAALRLALSCPQEGGTVGEFVSSMVGR